MIAEVNRDSDKRVKPFSPQDFMPEWLQPKPEPQNWKSLLAQVEFANAAFGGADLRGEAQ